MSIKGPLTYAGFLITHIENASVFLLTSYVTGALMLCCILCFFCGTIPFRNKEHHDSNLCVFTNPSQRSVYVRYYGVLDTEFMEERMQTKHCYSSGYLVEFEINRI